MRRTFSFIHGEKQFPIALKSLMFEYRMVNRVREKTLSASFAKGILDVVPPEWKLMLVDKKGEVIAQAKLQNAGRRVDPNALHLYLVAARTKIGTPECELFIGPSLAERQRLKADNDLPMTILNGRTERNRKRKEHHGEPAPKKTALRTRSVPTIPSSKPRRVNVAQHAPNMAAVAAAEKLRALSHTGKETRSNLHLARDQSRPHVPTQEQNQHIAHVSHAPHLRHYVSNGHGEGQELSSDPAKIQEWFSGKWNASFATFKENFLKARSRQTSR